ncbi:MAG: purS [Acidimicrobiia bacterium]|nr:purS [Acidimicrobiia bacterium]
MAAVHTLVVRGESTIRRAESLQRAAANLGVHTLTSLVLSDLVFIRGDLDADDVDRLGKQLLADDLLNTVVRGPLPAPANAMVIETALLPGVTDRVAAEIERAAAIVGIAVDAVATGHRYELGGQLSEADVDALVRRLLANPVIERWSTGAIEPSFPIDGHHDDEVAIVALRDLDTEQLATLNRERGLALDPAELEAIAAWFRTEGRDPTDAEIETLAQTWSEHCTHKTFRAAITTTTGETIEPLMRQLRNATDQLDKSWVVSAFVGNAGIVDFGEGLVLAVKVETHNHPSAVEPFGGANTGVGGVIRDVMAAPARPIATTDILCFGPLDVDPDSVPTGTLHPRRIAEGVIAGVADYGNKLGVPTVAGAILHDPGYTANPLVFCGCVGLVPPHEPLTGPHAGDRVVVLGGRTGRDGIKGATFSSMGMDATTGEVAGASVQIGDPITEKLVCDVLDEAVGLYSALTDCGAGGLSSAVGEMAELTGALIDLAQVPRKYPGLAPWEVWLSEAQERMVLAVPASNIEALSKLCERHGVEWADLGTFTGDGRLVVRQHQQVVLDLDVAFLHDGRPQRQMVAEMPSFAEPELAVSVTDPAITLLALLAHPTIASKEAVIRRYDHEVQGNTVVRPLCGVGDDGPSDGVVLAHPDSRHGFAIGIGVNPWMGLLDPKRMAYAVVDEAIRNVVVAGADPDKVALLDNFSWGDPNDQPTLGSLAAAVEGCVEASLAYGAPFVSGKDSLNNCYVGDDGKRHAVPPTLVITALAHVPDAIVCPTTDLAAAGDVLLLLGRTSQEFGGSHTTMVTGSAIRGSVPAPDPLAPARYRALHKAIRAGLVHSAHDVSEGGLAVTLAEMAIGGRLGADVTVGGTDPTAALFSESLGRIVIAVRPADVATVTALFDERVTTLGTVTDAPVLRLTTDESQIELTVDQLRAAWQPGLWG